MKEKKEQIEFDEIFQKAFELEDSKPLPLGFSRSVSLKISDKVNRIEVPSYSSPSLWLLLLWFAMVCLSVYIAVLVLKPNFSSLLLSLIEFSTKPEFSIVLFMFFIAAGFWGISIVLGTYLLRKI